MMPNTSGNLITIHICSPYRSIHATFKMDFMYIILCYHMNIFHGTCKYWTNIGEQQSGGLKGVLGALPDDMSSNSDSTTSTERAKLDDTDISYMDVCACVCVTERERERERINKSHCPTTVVTHQLFDVGRIQVRVGITRSSIVLLKTTMM